MRGGGSLPLFKSHSSHWSSAASISCSSEAQLRNYSAEKRRLGQKWFICQRRIRVRDEIAVTIKNTGTKPTGRHDWCAGGWEGADAIAGGVCIIVQQGFAARLCCLICSSFQHWTATGTVGHWEHGGSSDGSEAGWAVTNTNLHSFSQESNGIVLTNSIGMLNYWISSRVCMMRLVLFVHTLSLIGEALVHGVCAMWRYGAWGGALTKCPWKYMLRATSCICACVVACAFVSEEEKEINGEGVCVVVSNCAVVRPCLFTSLFSAPLPLSWFPSHLRLHSRFDPLLALRPLCAARSLHINKHHGSPGLR